MTNAVMNFLKFDIGNIFKAIPITKKQKYLLELKEHGYSQCVHKEIYEKHGYEE